MKSLIADAEWSPREGYPLKEDERFSKRALIGSQVWKNPHFELKDIPTPNVNSDEVILRVKACGICGSDTHLYETDKEGYIIFSGLTKLPCIIGHEFSGVVEKTGDKVINLKVGDIVAVESILWCGSCTPCRSGALNQCTNLELAGLSANGAFAEFIAVKEKYCWKLNSMRAAYDDEEIFEIGALIEPIGCAYNGIFISGGGFLPGSSFVVYGAGPIGLASIALAKAAGAGIIIAFDLINERLQIAKEFGADFTFNIHDLMEGGQSSGEKILELTNGSGANIQVEAAGAAQYTFPEMEKSLSANGKIVYLGRAATSTPLHLDTVVSGANKIIGSRGHSGYGIYPNIINLIKSGKLRMHPMITARYPFDKIMEALKKSTTKKDGKILVKM